MSTLEPVYNSKMDCPACEKNFEYGRVRARSIRHKGQDTDLCPIYEGVNPLFYDAIICPYCGFAYIGTDYSLLTRYDYSAVKTVVTPKWARRNFDGPRNVEQAIEAYKIVLFNSTARRAPASEFSRDCMRLAWMYRIRGDSVTEFKYLERAFQFYQDTFLKENLPVGRLDEFTVMYMIGEVGRRIGKYKDSLKWFAKLVEEGMLPQNNLKVPQGLMELARAQVLIAKAEMDADNARAAANGEKK